MSNFWITIIAAIILMGFVVLGLGIGKLISGKNRLRRGCGLNPDKKNKDSCSICGKDEKCDKGEKEDESTDD